ncbi:hypothetical protein GW17_00010607 [Ensete ventricosum]|nr:hypothetical protein GW17_00010607 [Ensete ventricosum]
MSICTLPCNGDEGNEDIEKPTDHGSHEEGIIPGSEGLYFAFHYVAPWNLDRQLLLVCHEILIICTLSCNRDKGDEDIEKPIDHDSHEEGIIPRSEGLNSTGTLGNDHVDASELLEEGNEDGHGELRPIL